MSAEFRKCLKQERDRERRRRESQQGRFEASMLSLDRLVDSFEDPSKAAAFSDGGASVERVCSFDEDGGSSYYIRAVDRARKRLERNCAELLEVFYLIVRNGKHRGESIAELASIHGLDRKATSDLYFGHRKKILDFFNVQ